MNRKELRIASLVPSATEIVAALGLTDRLVARSHECDWPPDVEDLPVCTRPRFEPVGTSAEINQRVTELLDAALGVYALELDVLKAARPTHIVTQDQCDVCAVRLADVEDAAKTVLEHPTPIISLQPARLGDVWADIRRVGKALGADAESVTRDITRRIARIAMQSAQLAEPRVATIEWADPLMTAGNWVPEMIDIAGGKSLFGEPGAHSPYLTFEALQAAEPEVIIFMPCGYDLAKTEAEARELLAQPEWRSLPAVRDGRVYATDGNAYFNRPGPRLVDSVEILAEILHPERFDFGHQGVGWRPLSS